MRPVVVIGAGGHGRDIAASVAPPAVFAGFLDDTHLSADVIGPTNILPRDTEYVVGILDARTRCRFATLHGDGPAGIVVHPSAHLGPGVQLAAGAYVGPHAVLQRDVVVGPHAHVGAGAFVTRSILGQFVNVGPNATVLGDVTVEEGAFIGAGAVVRNLCRVGRWATLGAGGVAASDIAENARMGGVPARRLR